VIKEIQKDLKDGKEGHEVYGKHEDVFGKFAAYMLSVASTSGNMALVFESTAKFLERDAEFKKNLRRSLLMPTVTVLAVIATILFYVGYIFPATAELFLEFDIRLPPMTAATLEMSYWLTDNWIALTLSFVIPIIAFIWYVKTPPGKLMLDKYIIHIPVIGDLLHKTSIEIFARVFFTLYSGSGQNIEVIKVAAEACRNSYMEKQIKEIAIKMMLKEGAGLVESMEATEVFTTTAISRFRLGAESGALRDNAKQLAEYYEIQTTYKMEAVIDVINLFINLFIMIALIAITVVSSEAALIQPN
jgi:type IV pilus assembly protein PilC